MPYPKKAVRSSPVKLASRGQLVTCFKCKKHSSLPDPREPGFPPTYYWTCYYCGALQATPAEKRARRNPSYDVLGRLKGAPDPSYWGRKGDRRGRQAAREDIREKRERGYQRAHGHAVDFLPASIRSVEYDAWADGFRRGYEDEYKTRYRALSVYQRETFRNPRLAQPGEEWVFEHGDLLKIRHHESPPGKGLTYGDFNATALESGVTGGWDVYEVRVGMSGRIVSVYGFSIFPLSKKNPWRTATPSGGRGFAPGHVERPIHFQAPKGGGTVTGMKVAKHAIFHDPATGERRKISLAEAKRLELEQLRTARYYFAYLKKTGDAPNAYHLTTFPGDIIAAVTTMTVSKRVGFHGVPYTVYHFRATDVHGGKWHGTSPGPGMYARMRRSQG